VRETFVTWFYGLNCIAADVTAQLKVVDGHKNPKNGASITFHLEMDNLIQTDAIATTNTHQHVECNEIVNAVCTAEYKATQDVELAMSVDQHNILLRLLGGIISKLDLLVQIADQKSKVCARNECATYGP
jgi:hypothetical protein